MEVKRFDFRPKDVTVFENGVIRVFVPRMPHTHAQYGGHLVVQTLKHRELCTQFTVQEALQVVCMTQTLTAIIIDRFGAARTNNQDNGNWHYLKPLDVQAKERPRCHVHIYGRSPKEDEYVGPGKQKWGKSLDFPLPDEPGPDKGSIWMEYIHPYSDDEIKTIRQVIPDYFFRYVPEIALLPDYRS